MEDNRHFWRGVFDGGGYFKNKDGKDADKMILTGSNGLCAQFEEYIKKNVPDAKVRIKHNLPGEEYDIGIITTAFANIIALANRTVKRIPNRLFFITIPGFRELLFNDVIQCQNCKDILKASSTSNGHEGGCPEGYHSHEDDQSGRCNPDSEECTEGYIMNPVYPECKRIEYVCEKHPSINECITEFTNLQNTSSRTAK